MCPCNSENVMNSLYYYFDSVQEVCSIYKAKNVYCTQGLVRCKSSQLREMSMPGLSQQCALAWLAPHLLPTRTISLALISLAAGYEHKQSIKMQDSERGGQVSS